jgi:PAS domain S-box-containing protein
VLASLPRGQSLPPEEWERRHHVLLIAAWLQVPALGLFAIAQHYGALHIAGHVLLVAMFAVLGGTRGMRRRLRSVYVALSFLTGAAIAVHSAHGLTEAHFYFFVVIVALTLYEDWVPFLLAVAYVALHHGVLGAIDRSEVYNHAGNPWLWAGIHAAFVLAAGAVALVAWRLNEDVRAAAHSSERARVRSDARYRQIVQRAGQGVWITDSHNLTSFVNPSLMKMLGYEADEMIGRPLGDFLHDDPSVDADSNGHVPQATADQQQVALHRRDGSHLWVLLSTSALGDGEGGSLMIVTDVDERVRAQSEAERLKSEFFALVSHELRTPLTSITGYLALVQEVEGPTMSDSGRQFVQVVDRNTRRLEHLVTDLLMLTQVEAGALALRHEPVDLSSQATQAVEAAGPAAAAKHLQVHLDADAGIVCSGDGERLGQVFDNLITNAIKFTPEGGHIQVSIKADGGQATIEVSDSGPGIAAGEQRHLFERFFRASNARAEHIQGVGLGLAIVKVIVEMHGGSITVESEEGSGSVFRVQLPMGVDQPDQPQPVLLPQLEHV